MAKFKPRWIDKGNESTPAYEEAKRISEEKVKEDKTKTALQKAVLSLVNQKRLGKKKILKKQARSSYDVKLPDTSVRNIVSPIPPERSRFFKKQWEEDRRQFFFS